MARIERGHGVKNPQIMELRENKIVNGKKGKKVCGPVFISTEF